LRSHCRKKKGKGFDEVMEMMQFMEMKEEIGYEVEVGMTI